MAPSEKLFWVAEISPATRAMTPEASIFPTHLLNSLLMTGPNRDLLTLLTFWTLSKRDLAVLRGDATWRTRASRELRLIVILVLFYFQCLIFYEVEKMFLLLWLYFLRPPSSRVQRGLRGGFDWRLLFEGFIENFISNLLTASPSTTFTLGGFSNGRPWYPVLWLIFSIFIAHTWLRSGYWISDELLIEFHFQFACKFHCLRSLACGRARCCLQTNFIRFQMSHTRRKTFYFLD